MEKHSQILAIFISIFLLGLTGCDALMSDEEKKTVAAVTCAEIKETRNMDGALRVRLVNKARDKIGGSPFTDGDKKIRNSVTLRSCENLILELGLYQDF